MEEKKYYCSNKAYAKHKHPYIIYKIILVVIGSFIPKFKINYKQKIEKPSIYVANHSKAYGVAFVGKWMRKDTRIWAEADLCFYKTAPGYMVKDFFGGNKLFWPLAILLTPIIVGIFRGAKVIPVYRDARLITTYKKTIETLKEGKSVVLFAENPEKYNKYINELNKGFVEVGRMINKYMKTDIDFVPMYIAWTIRQTSIGSPITFDSDNKYRDEVERITNYIKDELTSLAESLPEHKVINFNY